MRDFGAAKRSIGSLGDLRCLRYLEASPFSQEIFETPMDRILSASSPPSVRMLG